MKRLIILLLIAPLVMLSGCAMFADEVAKSASTVGKAFGEYCANMPSGERPAYKEAVEAEFGGTIVLTCPGDAAVGGGIKVATLQCDQVGDDMIRQLQALSTEPLPDGYSIIFECPV